jgi:hypothetical protein
MFHVNFDHVITFSCKMRRWKGGDAYDKVPKGSATVIVSRGSLLVLGTGSAISQQMDQRGSSTALTPGTKPGDELPHYGEKNVAPRFMLGKRGSLEWAGSKAPILIHPGNSSLERSTAGKSEE